MILFAFRVSKNHTTQFSPFFLAYGLEPRLPTDLVHTLETQAPKNHLIAVLFARIYNLISLTKERKAALEEIAAMQGKWQDQKHSKIAKINREPLKIGDSVLVFRNTLEKKFGKLDNRWIGPSKIIDKRDSGIFRLENSNGLLSVQWFHGDRLKKYISRNPDQMFLKNWFTGVHLLKRKRAMLLCKSNQ